MPSPFAALPVELVLSILSFAAVHQHTALALSLVSSSVHTHVEPALYHTVRLSSARALCAFLTALDRKPRGFAQSTVRRLCITALGPISNILAVLAECTGVTSLASGFSVPSYLHACCARHRPSRPPPASADTFYAALRHLQVEPAEQQLLALACRDGIDTAIVSPRVARLRVQLTAASAAPQGLARLGALRHLTHLALVGEGGFVAAVRDALERIVLGGRVSVLVLQLTGWSAEAYVEDIRRWGRDLVEKRASSEGGERSRKLVVQVWVSRVSRSFLSDWEEGDVFWQRAEESGGSV